MSYARRVCATHGCARLSEQPLKGAVNEAASTEQMVYWAFAGLIPLAATPRRIRHRWQSRMRAMLTLRPTIQGPLRSGTSHLPCWSGQAELNRHCVLSVGIAIAADPCLFALQRCASVALCPHKCSSVRAVKRLFRFAMIDRTHLSPVVNRPTFHSEFHAARDFYIITTTLPDAISGSSSSAK